MKPRVFIGSASESLDVARTVKGELAPEFDVSIWTDDNRRCELRQQTRQNLS